MRIALDFWMFFVMMSFMAFTCVPDDAFTSFSGVPSNSFDGKHTTSQSSCKLIFQGPLLGFARTKQEILQVENRSLLVEGKDELVFEGASGSERLIIYHFLGDVYSSATVLLKESQSREELVAFLKQKHQSQPDVENKFTFEGISAIVQDDGNLGLKVIYKPQK